jgi:phage-related protein
MRHIFFLGDTLDAVRDFPVEARSEVGAELRRVQMDLEPTDWKPMKTVGPGVREIRVRDATSVCRVIYVLNKAHAVYVLNAFQERSQKTPKHELELAARRLKLV